jgi:hypothetical protein
MWSLYRRGSLGIKENSWNALIAGFFLFLGGDLARLPTSNTKEKTPLPKR